MADDLHDALTAIDGIGDGRADEILAVFDEHGAGGVPVGVKDAVAEACEYHDAGRHEYAAKFVRRAFEGLTTDE